MVNCRSILNKTQTIQVEIGTHNIDLCALTETWIKQEDNITILACCTPNYKASQCLDPKTLAMELQSSTRTDLSQSKQHLSIHNDGMH